MRVVFDSNVVVSALLFSQGRLAWLRAAWANGDAVPLVSTATVRELLRVLSYPKFALTAAEIELLLGDYLPYGETVEAAVEPLTPSCRDPHDQMFVTLAVIAAADALVTGDRDLLLLDGQLSCRVITPAVFQNVIQS